MPATQTQSSGTLPVRPVPGDPLPSLKHGTGQLSTLPALCRRASGRWHEHRYPDRVGRLRKKTTLILRQKQRKWVSKILCEDFELRDEEVARANLAIAGMESEINAFERYTRGFNIRILGMGEQEGEDCIMRVNELLNEYFDLSEPAIENAHRVGIARAGKPRQVIARFHSCAIRRDVIAMSREKLHGTQYRMVDDLTAKDLGEKRRLRPLMEQLFKEKQRPRFTNGRLLAGGKPLSKETINAYLSKLPSPAEK